MPIDRLPFLYDSESVRGWRLMKTGLAFIIGLLFFGWMLFRSPESRHKLKETGVQVEGKVYKMRTLQNGREQITYGFTANGSFYSIDDRYVVDLAGLQPMGPIMVWYDPADPNRCVTPNELSGDDETSPVKGKLILVLVMSVILGGLALSIFFQLRSNRGTTLGD